jgi:hypothetical protein
MEAKDVIPDISVSKTGKIIEGSDQTPERFGLGTTVHVRRAESCMPPAIEVVDMFRHVLSFREV